MVTLTRTAISGDGGSLDLKSDDLAMRDLLMLIEGETSGRPLEEILVEFSRSRSAYYEKLRRFRQEGLPGLLAKPPGPRSPWRRTLEVLHLVIAARLKDPTRTARQIADELSEAGHPVSVRSIERTFTQFGLTRGSQESPRRRTGG